MPKGNTLPPSSPLPSLSPYPRPAGTHPQPTTHNTSPPTMTIFELPYLFCLVLLPMHLVLFTHTLHLCVALGLLEQVQQEPCSPRPPTPSTHQNHPHHPKTNRQHLPFSPNHKLSSVLFISLFIFCKLCPAHTNFHPPLRCSLRS